MFPTGETKCAGFAAYLSSIDVGKFCTVSVCLQASSDSYFHGFDLRQTEQVLCMNSGVDKQIPTTGHQQSEGETFRFCQSKRFKVNLDSI